VLAELRSHDSSFKGKTRKDLEEELCKPGVWANDSEASIVFDDATKTNQMFINARTSHFFCNLHADQTMSEAL